MRRTRKNRTRSIRIQKQSGGGLLVVLIIFALLAGAAYLILEQNSRLEALAGQQARSEAENAGLTAELAAMRASVTALAADEAAAAEQRRELAGRLEALNAAFNQARLGIPNGDGSQTLPILTEAAGLFRLARQYLIVSGDLASAESLYASGIDLLREVDDPAVDAVRTMMEDDLMRIRAAPRVDKENIHSQLTGLAERVAGLDLMPVAGNVAAIDPVEIESGDGNLLNRLMNKLDDYLIVRKVDDQVRPMLNAQESYRAGLAIGAQLEQAKLALLQENSVIYRRSIDSAIGMLERYPVDNQDKRNLIGSLQSLRDIDVSDEPPVPGDGLAILQGLLSAEGPGQDGAGQ